MSSATLTSPPIATARLVVETDVASYIFKWHPEFAPRYVAIVQGSELVLSFMTLGEMRQVALDANWGPRKCGVLVSPTFAAAMNFPVKKGRIAEITPSPSIKHFRECL